MKTSTMRSWLLEPGGGRLDVALGTNTLTLLLLSTLQVTPDPAIALERQLKTTPVVGGHVGSLFSAPTRRAPKMLTVQEEAEANDP